MMKILSTPFVTPRRVWLALGVAIAADAAQLLLAAPGWIFFDEAIDVVAMALMCVLLGFHPLFLPTFVVEFIPVVGMLPTWTACTIVVVALRRRQQRAAPSPVPPPVRPRDDVIDI
jgi:hypothetical protein